jgi:uncharacterized protein YbaP (TraB family)
MKKILLLFLFLLAGSSQAETDPKIAQFLVGMNKYYYCLARQGVTSLQADVTATMEGDVLYKLNKDGKHPPTPTAKYFLHFSYLGGSLMPVLSAVTVTGGTQLDYLRLLQMDKAAYNFTKLWGLFVTRPIFFPNEKTASYTFDRTKSGFVVGVKQGKVEQKMWFNSDGLAQWVEEKTGKNKVVMKVSFDHSPVGPILNQIDIVSVNGKSDLGVSFKVDYEMIEGLRLPTALTVIGTSKDHPLRLVFTFLNYKVHTKHAEDAFTPQQDYQVIPSQSEAIGAKHFFWKVTSPTATIYLLGSVHIRSDTPLSIPEVVDQAYQQSPYVAFEYDASKNDQIKKDAAVYFKKTSIYPAGDDLTKHLSPEAWNIVRSMVVLDGLDPVKVVRMKPVMLSNVLQFLTFQKAGLDPDMGIDQIFLRRAQKDNKTIFGLEFWWKPFEALNSMTDQAQAYGLIASVLGARNAVNYLNEVLRLWKLGDVQGLNEKVNSDLSPQAMESQNKILKDRNEQWLVQMDKLLASKGSYFIIVGSGHMVGQYGLPNWLGLKGYHVEQL